MRTSSSIRVFLMALSLAVSPMAWSADDDAVVRKFADHVYAIFLQGTNSIVAIGDTGVLVTDPANSARARMLKTRIAALTDKPVTKIVLSHEHTDHAGGTEEFPGAQIIAQESVRSIFLHDPLHQLPRRVDVTFLTGYTVDLGTTQVDLKYYGPAEGIANIVVYLPKESVVLLTDLYDEEKTLTEGDILDATNMVGIRKIYQEVSKWKPKYVLTAHSTHTEPRLMYEQAQYINDLYDAAFPRLQAVANDPDKVWELVQTLPRVISLPAYKSWKNYKDLPRHVYRMAYAIAYGG